MKRKILSLTLSYVVLMGASLVYNDYKMQELDNMEVDVDEVIVEEVAVEEVVDEEVVNEVIVEKEVVKEEVVNEVIVEEVDVECGVCANIFEQSEIDEYDMCSKCRCYYKQCELCGYYALDKEENFNDEGICIVCLNPSLLEE